MAGSFSDYLEDKVLRHVFTNTTYTPPSTLYVALFTTAASDTGPGTEVSTSATGYVRQSAAFSVSGTATTATNTAAIEWSAALTTWGTITHVGIFDAASAGNMIAWADLTTSRTINSGDIFRVPASSLSVTLT